MYFVQRKKIIVIKQFNFVRYFIDVSYIGTNYHGWQIQENASSIQQILEKSLSILLGPDIKTLGSSRTDTGVHALSQIVHFDSKKLLDNNFIYKINSILPADISVNGFYKVKEEANARFDAISREYIYKIHQNKNPFLNNRSLFYKGSINIHLMNEACKVLVASSDFQSFSKVKTEVDNFKCVINYARFEKSNDNFNFIISSNRFLRGMVRCIVGTLLEVSEKKISLEEFNKIVENKDRKGAGPSVLASGLYLSKIEYPSNIYI